MKSVKDPCGTGPFGYERFVFEGVDRGFKLTSAYASLAYPNVQIFVQKDGPPFRSTGKLAGQPLTQ